MTNTERIKAALAAKAAAKPATLPPPDPAQNKPGPVAAPPPPPPPPKQPKPKKPFTPHARDLKIESRGRLPDGSIYVACYDAKRELWEGIMYLPVDPKCGHDEYLLIRDGLLGLIGRTFRGTLSGVFKLIHGLDTQFRLWLQKQGDACATSTGGDGTGPPGSADPVASSPAASSTAP